MSFNVGTLTRNGDAVTGQLNVFDMFEGKVRLRALSEEDRSYSTKAPHFDVMHEKEEGSYKIGSAWCHKAKTVGKSDVFSMALDHPEWKNSLELSAFGNKNDASLFDVKWQR